MSKASGYQGSPGLVDNLNPTLKPNIYDYYVGPNGSCNPVSPAQVVLSYPRVAGTVTITVGGTPHAGDVLTVNVENNVLPNGVESVSYTVASGPASLAESGESLVAAINNDSVLQQHDIYATSFNAVVTLHQLGPLSNFTTVAASVSGSGHEVTLTVGNSGKLAGGSGPTVPLNNNQMALSGGVLDLRFGVPVLLNYSQLSAVVAAGLPAK